MKACPATDTGHAEREGFAAAVRGDAAYPLPAAPAIHGVALFGAIIGAAASGSSRAVA